MFKLQTNTNRIFRWFHYNNLISNTEKSLTVSSKENLEIQVSSRVRLHEGPGGLAGFSNWGRLVGGQFGQNGQKLDENYKIGIFGSKQWGEAWGGDKPIFQVVGGDPPQSPPLVETLTGPP